MNTKLLKQKILDLAIRGKLVPQDPNDEPASVLLERIKAEKERLIAEGKIKRSKKSVKTSDKPHYENVPFEIPDNWEWIRLSDIASFGGGKTPSMNVKSYWDNGSNLWVTSKDMKRYRIDDSILKISDEALSIMTQYEPGTILIVTRSGILRHSLPVAILDKKATVNQDLKTISLYLNELNPYIFLTIKANESFILKEYHKDGTTVDSINFEKFSNILLPLPPIREQQHICSVVEGLFRLIDDLEASKQDLQDVIKQTKSKVLDLAIHGKLVPQDPTDEPASKLLKHINPDAKPCDTSHYENLPFELPENWLWVKLSDICEFLSRGRSPKYSDDVKQYPVFAQKCNLFDGDISLKKARFLDPKTLSKWGEEYKLRDGDVLMNSTGTGTVCRTRLFHSDILGEYPFVVPDSHVSVIRTYDEIDSKFVHAFLSSKTVQTYLEDNLAGSTNQRELYIGVLGDLGFPLAPLNEQKRIVQAIQNTEFLLQAISAEL